MVKIHLQRHVNGNRFQDSAFSGTSQGSWVVQDYGIYLFQELTHPRTWYFLVGTGEMTGMEQKIEGPHFNTRAQAVDWLELTLEEYNAYT